MCDTCCQCIAYCWLINSPSILLHSRNVGLTLYDRNPCIKIKVKENKFAHQNKRSL